ncbi:MAG TPA: EAL domain-containing protein [Actinomycetota bacterium]
MSSSLTLEITETSIMGDPARSIGILERLSATGVALSIDDFGTGYSSLSYLKRLPVDEIKIDRSFVTGMSEQQWRRLRSLGCEVAQGFLLGRPTPATKLLPWLARYEAYGATDRPLPEPRLALVDPA